MYNDDPLRLVSTRYSRKQGVCVCVCVCVLVLGSKAKGGFRTQAVQRRRTHASFAPAAAAQEGCQSPFAPTLPPFPRQAGRAGVQLPCASQGRVCARCLPPFLRVQNRPGRACETGSSYRPCLAPSGRAEGRVSHRQEGRQSPFARSPRVHSCLVHVRERSMRKLVRVGARGTRAKTARPPLAGRALGQ